MEKLKPSLLKNIPTALGEVDVLKMVQTLPGVKTVGEASTGFNVRGGSADQNLMLLNGGTIYNPNHMFGFFTAFNSDMVADVELYKSSIPSQYGGRISSVLNITGKEASKESFSGVAGIGLLTSKLNLEIPIWKQHTSLLLSGRTTYSDWILGMLPEKSGYKDGKAGFYDVGATFSHTLNERNKLNIYGYYSRDRFAFCETEKYGYGNVHQSQSLSSGEKFMMNPSHSLRSMKIRASGAIRNSDCSLLQRVALFTLQRYKYLRFTGRIFSHTSSTRTVRVVFLEESAAIEKEKSFIIANIKKSQNSPRKGIISSAS
jgi:hypothetical protein